MAKHGEVDERDKGAVAAPPHAGGPGEVGRPRPEPIGLSTFTSKAAMKRTFSSLGDSTYRKIWFGNILQMGAMQVAMLAQGHFVYEMTHSPSKLGIVALAGAVGTPLVLVGGVLADRMEKKRLIQAGQLVMLLSVLLVALAASLGVITWHYFLVSSLIQSFTMPFVMPARQSIIPQLVKRDKLMNAIALNMMAMSLTSMVVPAIAGIVIAVWGIEGTYYFVTAMYVGAIVLTTLLPKAPPMQRAADSRMMGEMGRGIKFVWTNPAILMLFLLGFTQVMLQMPIRNVLPIFSADVFKTGPEGLGIMMSAMGLGSLMGALFVAFIGQVGGRGVALLITGVVSGLVVLGFSIMSYFMPLFPVALLFLALMGIIQAGRMTMQSSLTMEHVDRQYQGRVMSLNGLAFGLMPVAVLPLTILTEHTNAPFALGVMSLVFTAISIAFFVGSKSLRQLK